MIPRTAPTATVTPQQARGPALLNDDTGSFSALGLGGIG